MFGTHDQQRQTAMRRLFLFVVALFGVHVSLFLLSSCARIGSPDGGWFDETPPRVIGSSPADRSSGVTAKKIYINFSEYIKLENASENVIISPPQIEQPEIKTQGKRIVVELKDSLKEQTTYTIDFSDAITDNNEGNPLGNYTYTFSTGEAIDTLEVSGYVVDASNLEPIKGILVGLYKWQDLTADSIATDSLTGDSLPRNPLAADTLFTTTPMLRVSRTDSRGHFVIKGIAPGDYRIYALQDMDGNYIKNQKSETLAFTDDIITPSFKPDIRQDTIWRDSLRIERIEQVGYTHFLPDDIVLRAFTETLTDRYFLKSDRTDADHFSLYFTYGNDERPTLRGLDFDSDDAFVVHSSAHCDTLEYWLRDTLLVNRDTLTIEMGYHATDTLGELQWQTDTISIYAKTSYEKRQKELQKQFDEWKKNNERKKKRGQSYDSIMPAPKLEMKVQMSSTIAPDQNIHITFPTPIARIDTAAIHLYSKHDTLWYESPFLIQTDTTNLQPVTVIRGEWKPNIEYSLEMDSLAFVDIYGKGTDAKKQGFKVKGLDEYATILVNVTGFAGKPLVVELIDGQDKALKRVATTTGTAEFFYVEPKKYYLRAFVDDNQNGIWDTGDYDLRRQAETIYYYPEAIECQAKWDYTETWNPLQHPAHQQKPSEIVKQKGDRKRTVKSRNQQRAQEKGIPLSEIPKIE